MALRGWCSATRGRASLWAHRDGAARDDRLCAGRPGPPTDPQRDRAAISPRRMRKSADEVSPARHRAGDVPREDARPRSRPDVRRQVFSLQGSRHNAVRAPGCSQLAVEPRSPAPSPGSRTTRTGSRGRQAARDTAQRGPAGGDLGNCESCRGPKEARRSVSRCPWANRNAGGNCPNRQGTASWTWLHFMWR